MLSPSSSGLAVVIVIFSILDAIVFWTQHLVVLSLASTATKVGFSAKRSRPKRTSTSRYLSHFLSLSLSPSHSSKPDSDDFFLVQK
ncbi:uncharacterized protein DS421_16g539430 [Arachis hypogaea]|nr:uncharacterized protein DS421_16g539430 [Arachis hypogaea]